MGEARAMTPGKVGMRRAALATQIAGKLSELRKAGQLGIGTEFTTPGTLLDLAGKDIVADGGGSSPATGYPTQPFRIDTLQNDPRRPLDLLDVTPRTKVEGTNSVEWVELVDGSMDDADIQSGEGAQKAETNPTFALKSASLVTVAVHYAISTQALDDIPGVAASITSRCVHDVRAKLEHAMLNGDGSFDGFLDVAATYSPSATPDIDKIGETIAYMRSLGYNPSAVVLNPLDYFALVSERAAGSPGDGQYTRPPFTPRHAVGTAPGADVVDRGGHRARARHVSDPPLGPQ
jgi:hypothetical protein